MDRSDLISAVRIAFADASSFRSEISRIEWTLKIMDKKDGIA